MRQDTLLYNHSWRKKNYIRSHTHTGGFNPVIHDFLKNLFYKLTLTLPYPVPLRCQCFTDLNLGQHLTRACYPFPSGLWTPSPARPLVTAAIHIHIFTRSLLRRVTSSLQIENLSSCLFVWSHFEISNIGPLYEPRIMSYYIFEE